MNDYQSFMTMKIHRSDIHESYYNPRKISDENRKKLKKAIKENGLVMPLVWNKRTGNCVAGHQRLSILDELNKTQDYQIEVAVIDVDEQKEVELNVFLNNQSAMGEWDTDLLIDLKETFPELDFNKNLGFNDFDLDFIGIEKEEKPKKDYKQREDQFEQYKADFDQFKKDVKQKELIEGNSVSHPERNDKCLTIIFNNNIEKHDFMRNINQKEKNKFIKYDDFIDVIKEEYRV